jgi:DNA-binding transcriptional LysR family regulator
VANNLEEVRRMIVAGLGIGAIPVRIVARDVRDRLLWRLPPYENVMSVDIYLMINPAVRPSKTEAAFIEVLRETINSAPDDHRIYRDDGSRLMRKIRRHG